MISTVQIFVELCDEGVDVWRPVSAEHIAGDVYRILEQTYDLSTEAWQFKPGDEVHCKVIETPNGRLLAAVRKLSE
jgi:hypothetical protein